jgi:hypothetical protein
VHPYTSTIVAASHIDDLHAEAAAERLARSSRASSRSQGRIASALTSVWSLLSAPADVMPAMPKLTDYPFRS